MWSSVRHIPSMVGPCFQVRWSHGRTPLGAAWISEKGSFASFHQSCQTMPSSAIPTKVPVEVARGGSGVESGIGNKRTADEGKFQAPSLQAQGPLLLFAQGCTRERTRLAFASLCQASRKLRATALATCWNNRRKPVLFPESSFFVLARSTSVRKTSSLVQVQGRIYRAAVVRSQPHSNRCCPYIA